MFYFFISLFYYAARYFFRNELTMLGEIRTALKTINHIVRIRVSPNVVTTLRYIMRSVLPVCLGLALSDILSN